MERKLDPFGILIIAFVRAIGGGTIRDVLVGNFPRQLAAKCYRHPGHFCGRDGYHVIWQLHKTTQYSVVYLIRWASACFLLLEWR